MPEDGAPEDVHASAKLAVRPDGGAIRHDTEGADAHTLPDFRPAPDESRGVRRVALLLRTSRGGK
jgi:hypothetical protein